MEIIRAEEFKIQTTQYLGYDEEVNRSVAEIIASVAKRGDEAVKEYTLKFDHVNVDTLEISKQEIDTAYNSCDSYFIETLNQAKENIALYHKKQLREGYEINKDNGIKLGQIVRPLKRVGIYVPGGTASYPSTVLMDAIPAKIAGVEEVIMVTPRGRDGKVNPAVLASAKIAGVDRVFGIGGAQAVAALAYGTESVPKVDKIVGPGNAYVATAKRQVFGLVNIDMIAGPSEILVIADDNANPEFVASDLLGQAEHDIRAGIYLVCLSESFALSVKQSLAKRLALLEREAIASKSIANGKIIIAKDMQQAIMVANEVAPEHLELCVDNPVSYLTEIKNAGGIFLGNYAPEALGDYFAGTNHTLPTSGTARFASPLSVDDFIKKSSYIYYTKEALVEVGERVADFADREGLTAHAESIRVRLK